MKKRKYIFIVLVYKNSKDLIDFLASIKLSNQEYEVIIVNSFYDETTKQECELISKKYNCIFINIENNGYGYGNNQGIAYANEHFIYEYLIISNPDVIISKFDVNDIVNLSNGVIGPSIKTLNNKNQNPYWAINNKFAEYIIYRGYKKDKKVLIYLGIIINKVIRELFLFIFNLSKKEYKKVFALHGCFLVFPADIIKEIHFPFDDNMFLFAEEAYLAHLLNAEGISSYLTKKIKVIHKEDGSMNVSNINQKKEIKKSVVYYFEKYNNEI